MIWVTQILNGHAKSVLRAIVIGTLCVFAACATPIDNPGCSESELINAQIRMCSVKDAEKIRKEMIRSIWAGGLPKNGPDRISEVSSHDRRLDGVFLSQGQKIELWQIEIGETDFFSDVFMISPVTPNSGKFAIVHGDHGDKPCAARCSHLEGGLDDTVNLFLSRGFHVAVIQMPLTAWNADADGKTRCGPFKTSERSVSGHNWMKVNLADPCLSVEAFSFFLEPVIRTINRIKLLNPDAQIVMVGLSGGGWTTHLSAALDPRIDLSIPVAGALPLYARPTNRGAGDFEQQYEPFYGTFRERNDGPPIEGGGVVSWLEIFALGSIGGVERSSRKQVQVLLHEDGCCFSGDVNPPYKDALPEFVARFGPSRWVFVSDRSTSHHSISKFSLNLIQNEIDELDTK